MDNSPLVDTFGRAHDNLRISVTDRCNIRCFYCMPETGVQFTDLTEPDIVPIARFCRERGIEPRFIEFMPLDAQQLWDRTRVLTADEMIAVLSREVSPLMEIPDRDPRAPATEYRYTDGGGRVGFIASG